MNKTVKIILIAILAVVLVGGGIFVGVNWNNWFGDKEPSAATNNLDDSAEDYTGDKDTYQGQKNTDTIDIPGFDAINLKAGETTQSVNLYNPPQNTCYFRMALILSDGTKLWESGLVEPGKAIYEMEMNHSLTAGEYADATLKYECFSMDKNQSPLNGSEIKLTLNVLE